MENLESLKLLTKEDIDKRKRLDYKPPKRYSGIEGYSEKYLQKQIAGNGVTPVTISGKDKNGKIKTEDVEFVAAPIPDKHILLAMAFSKAEKFFTEMKNRFEEKGKIKVDKKEILTVEDMNNAQEGTRDTPLTTIECLVMSSHLLAGKNSSLLKSLKKGDRTTLNDFAHNLGFVYKALNELRNYHAHILHEPGPLKFENLYGENKPEKKFNQDEWNAAKDWFKEKMEEARAHRIKTLTERLGNTDISRKEKTETETVLTRVSGYKFEDQNGYVTPEALLFIACMFLRKGDAEYFVKKWTGLKKTEGAYRLTQVFFTYYSIRDKKSLFAQSTPLLKFRKIIGILCSMPEFENECFIPFNDYIQKHNDHYRQQADDSHSKSEKEKWNDYCIPVRKYFNPTSWYLEYLNDKGYLNGFKIACYKTAMDRDQGNALEKNEVKNITELKQKMKRATGVAKRDLTAAYKELKKNFLFKEPADANGNYCIKNENAIIQHVIPKANKGNDVTVQATLSSDVLMKWTFADLVLNTGNDIKNTIKNFIRKQFAALNRNEFEKEGVILPPCIKVTNDKVYDVEQARKFIKAKLEELERFDRINRSKKAPWKHEAKRKIDIILEFAHITYTFRALGTNKKEDVRRHEALSDEEYIDALEFIRFYGKEYGTPEFKRFFFEDKKEYFRSLEGCMSKSKTLEELYNNVYDEFRSFYMRKIEQKLNVNNLPKFIQLFKRGIAPNKTDDEIKKMISCFSVNQVVPHQLINIGELAKDTHEYKEWEAEQEKKNNERKTKLTTTFTTDFSLMRYILGKRNQIDTNSDFLMKIIMPELLSENKFPKNEKDKLQGNTSLFKTLMKNKTDELMLWEIAKYYWEKDYGKPYNPTYPQCLVKDKNKVDNTPYKERLFFYTLFNQELTVPLKSADKKEIIEIKIKPKKFDDEFQHYETEDLFNFIKSYKKGEKGLHYEEINKEMKDSLAKYLDELYLLLRVEKEIVKNGYEQLTAKLHQEAKTKSWGGYYFIFGHRNPKTEFEKAIGQVLGQRVFDAIHPSNNGFSLDDLLAYRNNILHQQIQPDKTKHIAIRKALVGYCIKNRLLN